MTDDPAEPAFPRIPEPLLAELAPRALAWSRQLCDHINPSGRSCAAYHGIWQYLRLFEIIDPPREDTPFLREVLGDAVRQGMRRVLLCGCADQAVPAAVQWAFAQAAAEADLTVIDLCETPLRICKWYAERTGLRLRTILADMLSFQPERPFDIVCTHSLLGLFSPAVRHELIARWRDVLVPGGLVVTVIRMAPGAPDLERFSAAQAAAFRDRFLHEAAARRDRLGLTIPQEEFAALADAFIAQNAVYPVRSEDTVRELFEGGGFRVERLGLRPAPVHVALSGPTQGAGVPVLQIVAMKA